MNAEKTKKIAKYFQPKDTVLLLEDGTEFSGWRFGANTTGFGEAVFNTAMAGYQEVLTDPSYWLQIVVMTYPHQGNYGINSEDVESQGGPKVSGFVVGEACPEPSNFTSEKTLDQYLKDAGIPGLWGVDTRALTLHIRNRGAMRCLIISKAERAKFRSVAEAFEKQPTFLNRDLIREVSTKEPYWYSEKGDRTCVVMDFGVKLNSLRELKERGFKVVVVPAKTTAREVLALKPGGVFLSNGPGDPAAVPYAIETVRELVGKKPIYGICMGHQLLGLALGGKTFKMKFGHRGVNHPVLNTNRKTVEISSQNHGYAVDPKTLPPEVVVTHVNMNDGTCAGLEYPAKKCFSVQYHPESSPGPHDSGYLFDRFAALMRE